MLRAACDFSDGELYHPPTHNETVQTLQLGNGNIASNHRVHVYRHEYNIAYHTIQCNTISYHNMPKHNTAQHDIT